MKREKILEEILKTKEFRLERIVSEGHASPVNFWYDQKFSEFVLLLSINIILIIEFNVMVF